MQEDCYLNNNEVILKGGIFKGANIRKKGEDIKNGKKILSKGSKLRAQDIALIASVGIKKINVFKKLTVGIFTTGNELFERRLRKGQSTTTSCSIVIRLGSDEKDV